jgi:peptide/nickel transport system substrate-binding protein
LRRSGTRVAEATCQILPPGFQGYRPYCPYTAGSTTRGVWTSPNLTKARALVGASGTSNIKITVWSWGNLGFLGPFTVKLLHSVGYKRVVLKVISDFSYFGDVGNSANRAQIGMAEWIADYPKASGFFVPIFTCKSPLAHNPANTNDAEFCHHPIDGQILQALAEQATNPDAARGSWESIDRQTVGLAPWVPLLNPKVVDVLATRVGNYQYSASGLGVLIDQLWVR